MLGLYVSDHPLLRGGAHPAREADVSLADAHRRRRSAEEGTAPRRPDGRGRRLLTGVQREVTKQGDAWAPATLEDLDGAVELMFFPTTYQL